jgi:DNA-directed RNA polymerase sigma subunit (sigma70/sigma32)
VTPENVYTFSLQLTTELFNKGLNDLLTDTERRILEAYFGIDGCTGREVADIALLMGKDCQQTRHILFEALNTIRNSPFSGLLVSGQAL